MDRKLWCASLVLALPLALALGGTSGVRAQNKGEKSPGAGASSTLSGFGSISGTVKAPKEFKAAKVYVKNRGQERRLHGVHRRRAISGGGSVAWRLRSERHEERVHGRGRAENHHRPRWKCATADFTLKEWNLPAEPADAQRPSQRRNARFL